MMPIKSIVAAGFALVALSGYSVAFADETTTTTHTESERAPAAKVGVPGVVGVEVGGGREGCQTKSTTRTNDAGDSTTRTRTNC